MHIIPNPMCPDTVETLPNCIFIGNSTIRISPKFYSASLFHEWINDLQLSLPYYIVLHNTQCYAIRCDVFGGEN